MNNLKTYSLLGLCVILLFLSLFKSCEVQQLKQDAENHPVVNSIPDTVFVSKPYKVVEIKTKYIEKPVKVLVYLKDTILRKQVEHSNIITGINFKPHHFFQKMDFIKIDKITPSGIALSNEYEVPPIRELNIDLNGNLQTKKKRYIVVKIIASAVIIGTASYFIHQEFQK